MTPSERIRRVEVGAAIGAVGVVGSALAPFLEQFAAPLTERVSYRSGGDLDALRVETVIEGVDALQAWVDLLRDAYGLSADNALLVEDFALRQGGGPVAVAVTEARETSVPALEFDFLGRRTSGAVFPLLREAGVDAAVLEAWDTLLGRLRVRDLSRFGIRLDDPLAAPRFQTTLAGKARLAERAAFQASLDFGLEALGISEAQRRWFGGMVGAFAVRDLNAVDLTVRLRRDGLDHWLRASYFDIPVRFALKLLTQFSRAEHLGARLGALATAAGRQAGDDDRVDALHIVAWNGEPPQVAVDLANGPPSVASA